MITTKKQIREELKRRYYVSPLQAILMINILEYDLKTLQFDSIDEIYEYCYMRIPLKDVDWNKAFRRVL